MMECLTKLVSLHSYDCCINIEFDFVCGFVVVQTFVSDYDNENNID